MTTESFSSDLVLLDEHPAMCVTALPGFDLEGAVSAFSAVVATPVDVEDASLEPSVGLVQVEGGIVAVEVNGYEGASRPRLRAMSAAGRACSVYWNVDGRVRLSLAERGTVSALYEDGSLVEGSTSLDREESLFGNETVTDRASLIQVSVRALQWFTGLSFGALILLEHDEFFPLLPMLPELPKGGDYGESWRLAAEIQVGDPELIVRILELTSAERRALARWAAREAIKQTGLIPTISNRAVEDLEAADPEYESLELKLRRLYRDWYVAARIDPGGTSPSTLRANREYAAGEAIRAAITYLNPLDGAIEALVRARQSFGSDDGLAFLESVRRQLARPGG